MNYTEAVTRFTGKFLEPIDGIIVKWPLHENLGRSSPGGELYCLTCLEWFLAMPPDQPLYRKKLERKQAALRNRIDGVLRECDVAVIEEAEAETCRRKDVPPRSSKGMDSGRGQVLRCRPDAQLGPRVPGSAHRTISEEDDLRDEHLVRIHRLAGCWATEAVWNAVSSEPLRCHLLPFLRRKLAF